MNLGCRIVFHTLNSSFDCVSYLRLLPMNRRSSYSHSLHLCNNSALYRQYDSIDVNATTMCNIPAQAQATLTICETIASLT